METGVKNLGKGLFDVFINFSLDKKVKIDNKKRYIKLLGTNLTSGLMLVV